MLFVFLLPGAPLFVFLFGTLFVFIPKCFQVFISFVVISYVNMIATLFYQVSQGYPFLWLLLLLASCAVKFMIIPTSSALSSHFRQIPPRHLGELVLYATGGFNNLPISTKSAYMPSVLNN
jgi:hypothetical protein